MDGIFVKENITCPVYLSVKLRIIVVVCVQSPLLSRAETNHSVGICNTPPPHSSLALSLSIS